MVDCNFQWNNLPHSSLDIGDNKMRSISRVVINREDIVRYDHDVKQKIITIYVGK